MLLLSKFKISGHSMEPFLKNQDIVFVSILPYLFKSPKINDIVAFEDKRKNILIKRIAEITNSKFIVKGDNKKDSFDSRSFGGIAKKQILGKLIYTLPDNRNIKCYLI